MVVVGMGLLKTVKPPLLLAEELGLVFSLEEADTRGRVMDSDCKTWDGESVWGRVWSNDWS
jgi:hypothetical protein